MGLDAFQVATEFRFDVGQAVLNTDTLKGAVDDLNKSANSAMSALNYLAAGLVTRMGLGAGGLTGVMSRAVSVSEQWQAGSINFANNISSNMKVLTGTIDTFNDRLGTSQMIMDNIGDRAIKLGLDAGQLTQITQLLSTPLANRGKLGKNYEGAIGMASNLSVASEAVGLNPALSGEMLSRAITDHMSIHGALFARLVNTQGFKEAHVGTQSQLMNMNTDKKIDLLSKSLAQLAGDAGFVAARLDSLRVQFLIFKQLIDRVLKPIGDAIVIPLKMAMKNINGYLLANGREIGNTIGKTIGAIIGDPELLYKNLYQLSRFKGDFRKAVDFSSTLFTIGAVLSFFTKTKSIGHSLEKFLGVKEGMGFLSVIQGEGGIVAKVFGVLELAFMEFIPVAGALLFLFQAVSRAWAIVKINDAKLFFELMPRLMALFERFRQTFQNITMPLQMALDGTAQWIAILLDTAPTIKGAVWLMEQMGWVLDRIGNRIVIVMGFLSGFFAIIIGFIADLAAHKNPFTNIAENAKGGFNDFLEKHPLVGPGGATPASKYSVTNNNHIEARFDMREQMEPDRIAFAVTTHLKKLAINPTQGGGQSMHGAFGNPRLAGNGGN